MPQLPLVLASTSPYRRMLLERLGLTFSCRDPRLSETHQPGESAEQLVARLACEKALAAQRAVQNELIIGSDQVAVLDDHILGKPLTHDRAVEQLAACSGRSVTFYTGLCLLNTATQYSDVVIEPFRVHFRKLSTDEIDRYLRKEQPYQCAGSFMSEGLGITLFERLEGDDPSSLIGLPLIQLVTLLKRADITLP